MKKLFMFAFWHTVEPWLSDYQLFNAVLITDDAIPRQTINLLTFYLNNIGQHSLTSIKCTLYCG